MKQAQINEINRFRKSIGLPVIEPKERRCLICDHGFLSMDPSHRVCDKCRPGFLAGSERKEENTTMKPPAPKLIVQNKVKNKKPQSRFLIGRKNRIKEQGLG